MATWTVLVTLDAPKEEPELRNKLIQFRKVIQEIHTIRSPINVTKQIWRQRLDEIESTMATPRPVTGLRVRRALIDLIGIISSKLFGTATEAEVKLCKRQIKKAQKENRRVIHTAEKLITIVNQTHDQVKENRKHVRNIEKYVNELAKVIQKLQDISERQNEQIQLLDTEMRIDQSLSAIESAHNVWLRQLDKYQRQRASLELGWLTEEVLPPKELDRILTMGRKAGFHTPSIEWYYEHVRIYPMWEDKERLVFRAELPFMDQTKYLRYRIWTWPVPTNSSGYYVRLQVPDDVALDTTTGGLFEPVACQGHDPSICRTGPIYDRTRLQCPRGILTGDDQLRTLCKVTIDKRRVEVSSVDELAPGMFVIVTPGEDYSLHCTGKPEERVKLTIGVYVVNLKSGCRIQGNGWTIVGVITGQGRVDVKFPPVQIAPFLLNEMVSPEALQERLKLPSWSDIAEIKDISLPDLSNIDENEPNLKWGSHPGHFSWTAFIGLLVLLVVFGMMGYWLLRKRIIPSLPCPTTCVLSQKRKYSVASASADNEEEMHPVKKRKHSITMVEVEESPPMLLLPPAIQK
jgi:hypothetical protein